MRILITGGTGFIGSHLAAALARRPGYEIVALGRSGQFKHVGSLPPGWQDNVTIRSGDINDFDLLQDLVVDADVIFHKVASVGVAASAQSTRQYVQANIGGTACLVEALQKRAHHVKKVVLDSSIGVYGEGNYQCLGPCGIVRPELRYKIQTTEASNGQVINWDPLCPRCRGTALPVATGEEVERKGESVYAITKKTQEDLLLAACKRSGVPLAIMRYSSVYGPGQSEANFCAELMRMLAAGRQPMINEDGMQTRDYISVADVVAANLLVLDSALDADNGYSHYNVVSGQLTSFLGFVTSVSRAVSEVLGTPLILPVVTGGFNPADVRHCHADGSRMRRDFGFEPQVLLEDGIHALAEQHATSLKK